MKPVGPIPPEFAGQNALRIAGRLAEEWVELAGSTPLFVYDFSICSARLACLRDALPEQVDIHYAIKANPFIPLVRALAPIVDGLDVASMGELRTALSVKPARAISFAGPGKRDAELEAAILAGATINLESEGEATRALGIGERTGITPQLAVRVNPDFELRGSGMRMGGRASPFGVDANRAAALVRLIRNAGADWRGFHLFAGSQSLDTQGIIEMQAATLDLAARLAEQAGAAPPLVNLGGGFGIPYFHGDRPVDVDQIGAALGSALVSRAQSLDDSRFAIELGRWLVAEAGVYLTRIVDRKLSQGETFAIVDGGLHHQLAASGNFGTVVRRNYPVALAGQFDAATDETVTIVGCLCTPLDRLAEKIALPQSAVGDLVAIFLAGAYGLSASPSAFLSHPVAGQILVGSPRNPNAIFTS